MRITTDNEINNLVEQVTRALPTKTEDAVEAFLNARFTAYNRDKRIDAHLKTKAGKTYLPYPANVRFVGRLYDSVKEDNIEDDYDI